MTDQLPEQASPKARPKFNIFKLLRWSLVVLLSLILAVIIAVVVLAGSDRGSRWILDSVLNRQSIISYQYQDGNLIQGIGLKDILVKVKDVEVKIDQTNLRLGWRAILNKEIHLMTLDAGTVQVINHAPPNDEPFKFNPIKLPFTLRLDSADIEKLVIQSAKSKVNFYNIHLNEASWVGTKVALVNSALAMDFLSAKNITGFIQLDHKYPLGLTGHVNFPALKSLHLDQIALNVKGDVDTLRAGVASATPDIISGYAIVHPVRKNVPMQAKLAWEKFHWPVATAQKLYSDTGKLGLSGDLNLLNLTLDTDLAGQDIPKGQYQALLNTNLKQLNIEQFAGQLMNGQVDLSGFVSWQQGVSWDVSGYAQGINPKDAKISETIRGFLPPNLAGQIATKGSLKQGTDILATVDFDQYERWDVHLKQKTVQQNQAQPWLMDVSWQDMNRAFPYVGWLTSPQGQVDLVLAKQGQDIQLSADIEQNTQSSLPAGHYVSSINFAKNVLSIKDFSLTQGDGVLSGRAIVNLPTDKTQLSWGAALNSKQFNPQTIHASAPITRLDGSLMAKGYQDGNKQVVKLQNVDLTGQMPQSGKVRQIDLTGQAVLVALMHDGKQQKGLKSFAVQYDGQLNAQNYSQGPLKLNISGTPSLINISRLYHQGAAGGIDAKGTVNLANGLAWDIRSDVQQLKPQYFLSNIQGEITGQLATTGHWSKQQKDISIQDLNLRGHINNKALLGRGNLALNFNGANGFVPQQFEANDLVLSYANNVVYATGNTQRLQLNINAPYLSNLYQGLKGQVKGFISIQSTPQLSAKSNLIMQNFAYNGVAAIEKMSLVGTLPTANQPSTMRLNIQNLSAGERKIDSAVLELLGTRQAHIVKVQAQNSLSKFYTQLAGGFNTNNDWLGQLQKGAFDSKRVSLKQSQPASVVYHKDKAQLAITKHCWENTHTSSSQICLEQPLVANKEQGAVSIQLKSIELNDFQTFMPAGLVLSGKLNGYSHVSWQKGQPLHMDTQLVTEKGQIGLTNTDDPDAEASTLAYNEIRLGAKTLGEGLALRLNADSPLLGTGFVNVLVGTTGQDKSISGNIALDQIKLSLFKPFITDIRILDGKLSAAGKLSGTLKQPLFNGEIRLKDGQFAMISVPLDLQNIQLMSSIRGSQATLTGGFNAGRGVGKISGQANWGSAPHIKLNLSGKELLVAQPPMVSAAVSPDIDVEVRPTLKQLVVNGKIVVPKAVISMPEGSPNVVATSSDVRIVRAGEDSMIVQSAKPWHIRANIGLSLGDAVVFRGFNSVMPLAGKLNLTQRGTELSMQAIGAMGVSRQVKIEAYGQSLDLNRAIARFGGALSNPSLDIDATKDVQNSTIGIRVAGQAARPDIKIYNDAGLTEQEALNALLTGRISSGSSGLDNTEGFKSDVNNTIAAAGISMGLGGTRAFTNQIGRSLGLSGLALDAQGSGDDTQVSLTGYITPDLYLRYGVGIFTPVNKLTLRYQVNRRLYMEASSSIERAVDVFYNWRF